MKKRYLSFFLVLLSSFGFSQNIDKQFEDSIITYLQSPYLQKPNQSISKVLSYKNISDSLKLRLYALRFIEMEKLHDHKLAAKRIVNQGIVLEHIGADSEEILNKIKSFNAKRVFIENGQEFPLSKKISEDLMLKLIG